MTDTEANMNLEESGASMGAQETNSKSEPRWYVAHTYSGYENKVKTNIEKTIANRHLEDKILEVRVPLQEVEEVKGDKRKVVQRKMFPGYVLVHMIHDQETWYVVRNTRGVTGFVGPESDPVPLTELEMFNLGIQAANIEVSFKIGDKVTVVSGLWKGTVSEVTEIDTKKQTVTITVETMGREVPMDVNFSDIRKL